MKPTKKMTVLLKRMAAIERMERGTLSQMTGRPYYNHQVWRNGRNEVRYVRADEVEALREAIEGYRLFMHLAEKYVDEVVRHTTKQKKDRT